MIGPEKNKQSVKLVINSKKDGHELIAEVVYYEQDFEFGAQKWTTSVVAVAPHCTCGWSHWRAYQRTEYVTSTWLDHVRSVTKVKAKIA